LCIIYGQDDQSIQPRQLREVTFQLSPAQLRRVAEFLLARAAEIETGDFVDGGRHLRDELDHPLEFDVIVVPPPAG
jgi:hypothetical protein